MDSHTRRRSFFDPHNIVYATIILLVSMDVVQYGASESDPVSLSDFLVLAIGPLIMVAIAHSFAGAIEVQVRQRRLLAREDYRHLGSTVLQYACVALVPSLIGMALWATGQDLVTAARITSGLGLVSLLLWGYYAGRSAGHGAAGRIGNALIYGFVGLLIILLEIAVSH